MLSASIIVIIVENQLHLNQKYHIDPNISIEMKRKVSFFPKWSLVNLHLKWHCFFKKYLSRNIVLLGPLQFQKLFTWYIGTCSEKISGSMVSTYFYL